MCVTICVTGLRFDGNYKCCYDMSQIVLCAGIAWGGHLGAGRRANDAVRVLLGGETVTLTVTDGNYFR